MKDLEATINNAIELANTVNELWQTDVKKFKRVTPDQFSAAYLEIATPQRLGQDNFKLVFGFLDQAVKAALINYRPELKQNLN